MSFRSNLYRGACLALLLSFASATSQAQSSPEGRVQDKNFNTWLMFFSDARLTDRWGLHTEWQWRRSKGVREPLQDFGRIGINFYAGDKAMLTAGYAYALTHPYGDFPAAEKFPEHRLYEQLQLRSEHGPFQVSQRYRLEQRWIQRPQETDFTYTNRARYQIRAVLPLAGPMESLRPGTPYLAAYDEIFVNFGRNVAQNIFDQNRAYGALGYQFTRATAVEVGYLHQLVAQGNGLVFEHNHTLQLSLTFNPDFRASER
ncbi:DUF2490 domain-containing protein [Hymenobacter saemangeumensis]|uniref:DUF2490 domain-containing protein n=1 Tax=Hymenobacter saemangeumensis TaxID=1084522 RepID=A0ABP8IRQ8_9BACT